MLINPEVELEELDEDELLLEELLLELLDELLELLEELLELLELLLDELVELLLELDEEFDCPPQANNPKLIIKMMALNVPRLIGVLSNESTISLLPISLIMLLKSVPVIIGVLPIYDAHHSVLNKPMPATISKQFEEVMRGQTPWVLDWSNEIYCAISCCTVHGLASCGTLQVGHEGIQCAEFIQVHYAV